MITSTTIKKYTAKVLRFLFIAIVMIYAVLAAGLWAVNRMVAKEKAPMEAVSAHSKEPHQIRLLDQGNFSFHERLRLIEGAKKSIEIEFFIYNVDRSSRIFTQALIEKAKQGVKVRILVDFSAPVFQLRPAYARLMKEQGIETRYYNTSGLHRIVSMQHRSHRKLLIVDDESVITGGRNIGDEYFDMKPDYNFLDSDIELRGPVVAAVRKSFDVYWDSGLSLSADEMEVKPEDLEKARAFFVPQPGDQDITAKIRREGQELSPTVKYHECRDLSFDTDFPNQGEANRRVFKAIAEEIKAARTSILAESPYFVIKPGGYAVLENLKEREIAMTFLTNGLHSTDAFYTVASLFFNAGWLAKTRMTLYAFKGDSIQPDQSPETFGARDRWGIHSKRAVLDDHTVMVGTYNIDPRSANLNSELMVICRNQPELAKEFTQKIQARIAASRLVIDKGYADRWALLGGSSLKQILIFLIALPVSNLFDFLL